MFKTYRPQGVSSLLMSLLSSVMICLLAGCGPDIKDLREQAIEQYRDKQYIESMATLREVLEMKRTDPLGNYYMGLNYRTMAARKFRDGDTTAAARELDTAVLYFREAVKSWPNFIAAADAENEALETRGKYDKALAVSERMADNNRGIAEHYVVLGNEYRERGDYDNALRSYKLAQTTDPGLARTYSEMGQLYLRIGDQALASDALRKAHELDKHEPGVAAELRQME